MGNTGVQVVRPVSIVYGKASTPLPSRPACVGTFFDASQGASSGIIVVTDDAIENFSAKTGGRAFVNSNLSRDNATVMSLLQPGSSPKARTLCCTFNPSCSIGSCVIAVCSDLMVRVFDSTRLKPMKQIKLADDSDMPTAVSCPMNNALVVGLADGSLVSYFLETGELAGTYKPPRPTVQAPPSTGASSNGGSGAKVEASESEHKEKTAGTIPSISTPSDFPVSCIAFYEAKGQLLVGHCTPSAAGSPGTGQEDVSLPLRLYSLQSGKCLKEFHGAAESVRAAAVLPVAGGKNPAAVAMTSRALCVWDMKDGSLVLRWQIRSWLPQLRESHRCISATIDTKSSPPVIFASFDAAACVASVALHLSVEKEKTTAAAAAGGGGEGGVKGPASQPSIQTRSEPLKLYAMKDEDDDPAFSRLRAEQRHLCVLWFDTRTETLVCGDGAAAARAVPDIHGNQARRAQERAAVSEQGAEDAGAPGARNGNGAAPVVSADTGASGSPSLPVLSLTHFHRGGKKPEGSPAPSPQPPSRIPAETEEDRGSPGSPNRAPGGVSEMEREEEGEGAASGAASLPFFSFTVDPRRALRKQR
uniref:Uncharacterized protein n=1 Tax=Chromera velia CCMP2878 TaxID=1169474 RepID=A0A0G4H3X5_9ALVE|mmetsp:Transcript_48025/g.94842  ORF Transcript_48025/g.94842 Transcript_48025/m.94842 type:complete len:587 (+) Transcript_48025:268-2028(+)|eukprot:Cvel_24546.t1-p1 / transcript=Cvel_24546.t1 / gene=Cvel_24546 / organism=Chromera_velia_CCMP2878 / gene_product=hypothetical protein / transcript_product=hypothetical protein / location=Cvel_scaffold2666:17743-19500(-) / protein_length=586 / sequence_SO=supercontig / SO=protein_coding / is_pseudo=false